MSKICVLLATHQGRRYLPDFLESLERQTDNSWTLQISDDGSTDGTLNLLREYEDRWPSRCYVHENSRAHGAKENFAGLLERNSASDYYFFADQDDIWLPNKLERLLKELKRLEMEVGAEVPLLVHSDLRLLNERGLQLHPSLSKSQNLDPQNRRHLRHLLVQNNVTGCAMVINQPLRELALPIPPEAIMHDSWLAIVAAAFGEIGYVAEPLVGYRQHPNNAIGAEPYTFSRVLERLGSAEQVRESLAAKFEQAASFLARFSGSLSTKQSEAVAAFATLPNAGRLERRRRIFTYGFWMAGGARNLGMLLYL